MLKPCLFTKISIKLIRWKIQTWHFITFNLIFTVVDTTTSKVANWFIHLGMVNKVTRTWKESNGRLHVKVSLNLSFCLTLCLWSQRSKAAKEASLCRSPCCKCRPSHKCLESVLYWKQGEHMYVCSYLGRFANVFQCKFAYTLIAAHFMLIPFLKITHLKYHPALSGLRKT